MKEMTIGEVLEKYSYDKKYINEYLSSKGFMTSEEYDRQKRKKTEFLLGKKILETSDYYSPDYIDYPLESH